MRGEGLDVAVENEVEIQTALHFPLAIFFSLLFFSLKPPLPLTGKKKKKKGEGKDHTFKDDVVFVPMPKSVAAVVSDSAAAGGGAIVSLSMVIDIEESSID